MGAYSHLTDAALRQAHAECLERFNSMHAKYNKLSNQGKQDTREGQLTFQQGKALQNEMVEMSNEAEKRGFTLPRR